MNTKIKILVVLLIVALTSIGIWSWIISKSESVVTEHKTSYVIVEEITNDRIDGEDFFLIQGYDPFSDEKNPVVFIEKDERLVNLISINEEYFMSYSKKEYDNYYTIDSIKHKE